MFGVNIKRLSDHKWVLITSALMAAVIIQDTFISPKFASEKPVIDETAKKRQEILFEKHCQPQNYEKHLAIRASNRELFCSCKPDTVWKRGCVSKLELLSRKPFVLKIHGPFQDQSDRIGGYANATLMRPVMLGNEYGQSWVSPYINSEDGVLPGSSPVVREIYTRLAQLSGMVYPCGGEPGASIVRYRKGGFVGIHFDAPDLRVEQKLGFWLGGQIFRSFVSWLEDCRHFYTNYNIWTCLYLASKGKLEKSTSWNNYAYGPQIATIMIQLSELQGGETFFPLLNLTVPTTRGDVLIWGNLDDHWQRHPYSMHAGCPVLSEEKLIIVVFMPGKCNTFDELTKNLIHAPM